MVRTIWLTPEDDLKSVHEIRRKVFIEEQNVPETLEMDDKDSISLHLLILNDQKPVATGRLLKEEESFVLGRIAVLPEARGQYFGDWVVRMLTRKAFEMGAQKQIVHAQIAVQGFYEKLGYVPVGDIYMEADIPHITMVHHGDMIGDCCI